RRPSSSNRRCRRTCCKTSSRSWSRRANHRVTEDTEKAQDREKQSGQRPSFSLPSALCLLCVLCDSVVSSSYFHSANRLRISSPTFWLFSGWNCVANTFSCQIADANGDG